LQGKKEFKQRIYYDFNLDSLVPETHLLKRIAKTVSFDFVRDKTKDYYSHTGKPSIDPVVLVKMLLIGYLFDIRSERRLVEEVSLNLAYRWYIGYDIDEAIPEHSIFSKARARFTKELFCQIFEEILKKADGYGLVKGKEILIDSTIVKANASLGSIIDVDISPEEYWQQLDKSEEKNSKYSGSHYDGSKIDKTKIGRNRRARNGFNIKKKSTTDPEATMFYRPGAVSVLSFKAHIASDTNGFITAIKASPSALHDTGAVPDLIEAHEKIFDTPDFVAADKKYGSEECLAYLQEKSIKTVINPETKNNRPGYYAKEEFKYQKDKDIYICPNGKILRRKAKNHKLNRLKYAADTRDCTNCPLKERCISPNTKDFRFITKYDSDTYEKAYLLYKSPHGKILQKFRKTVLEGIMGQTKEYHGVFCKSKFLTFAKIFPQAPVGNFYPLFKRTGPLFYTN